jgi:hypothetical protein
LPKSGKDVLCVQCAEKKRAIEAELNSGQQMQINFTPERVPEYAQYLDSISFTDEGLIISNVFSSMPHKNPNLVKEDSYWAKPPSVYVEKSGLKSGLEAQIEEAMDKIAKSPYPGKLSEPGTGVKSGKSFKTATGVSEMYKPWVDQPWV